jgi:hypothetical protein
MSASTNHHLSQLDRTLVHLLNERTRLVASMQSPQNGKAEELAFEAHMQDLMRRSSGPFPADALRSTFEQIQAGCEGGAL